MARPSWNDIHARASVFSTRWAGETYERGESQTFWTEFLELFGIDRRRAGGYFEYAVKFAGSRYGFVDMFLPGKLLAEQKSAGRDLSKATAQALRYLDGITDTDLPQAIVASDFTTMQLMDLSSRELVEFPIAELALHVRRFSFLVDEWSAVLAPQDPVDREAAERMAQLHNNLNAAGYQGHKLELFLVRLVFCHFADDARIFEPGAFESFLRNRTSHDGSDVGPLLGKLFEVLNTPPGERAVTLDEDLAKFPYINGGLFAETTTMPDFDRRMRSLLLQSCLPDWEKVSPAIFGSMFQGVMESDARHDLGAHYTSEENILRVIKPLFLDALYAEFEKVRDSPKRLDAFHDKLANLKFLDPACGCGNFLVIAYRELRRLEHKVVDAQMNGAVTLTDVRDLLRIEIDQFYGIEISEFPALIASTALWLTDHQMNLEASARFGEHYTRIPLGDGATIAHGDALTLDWSTLIEPKELDFILGNPPFLGSRTMDATQKSQLRAITGPLREAGFLDFVCAWYFLADRMMALNPKIESAFVSTNSIAQGEQPGILWEPLLENGERIQFAHNTFRWTNDARGVAAVHCVIVGFSRTERRMKQLFEYPDPKGEPVLRLVDRINPYLANAGDSLVRNLHQQISGEARMAFGNMPADGGKLILSPLQRSELLAAEPQAERWVLPLIGADDFINRTARYCLWLEGASSTELRAMPTVYERVKELKEIRLESSRPQLALTPHLFAQITQRPDRPFLLIPAHSSESRRYIPMGFLGEGNIAHNSCLVIADATLWHFGILTSRMHMDWMRAVAGRLESRYRYSKDVVYNNFVFPKASDSAGARVEEFAGAVLAARERFPADSLAALYDPVTMPLELSEAHDALDLAVESLYQSSPFTDAEARVAHLFSLHRLALREVSAASDQGS